MAAVAGGNDELLGYQYHGFRTMDELRNSVTIAYEERRWLDNEEKVAMLLNPEPFMWNHPAFVDSRIYRDSFFFLMMQDTLDEVYELSDVADDRWSDYAVGNTAIEEKELGGTKNLKNNRRYLDREEISCRRLEIKGKNRQRRRSLLPLDLAIRAPGIHPPIPGLMVVEYQRLPSELQGLRVQRAQEAEALDDLGVLNNERLPQPGPATGSLAPGAAPRCSNRTKGVGWRWRGR
uniref:Uncharacterized protein n=1 Tax=Leersia perrieri TaxID=77586 RepID=A0A0D9XY20_9ORYZ